MPHSRAKIAILAGLAVTGTMSVAAMLLVSVNRWFLPGVIELSSAFAAAGALGLLWLAGGRGRPALYSWVDRLSWRTLNFAGAGVAVLAVSAALALVVEGFPWPVALLASVLIVLIGAADPGTRRPENDRGGGRRDGEVPPPPVPAEGSDLIAVSLSGLAAMRSPGRVKTSLTAVRPAGSTNRCRGFQSRRQATSPARPRAWRRRRRTRAAVASRK
jgi:hypothetical protein